MICWPFSTHEHHIKQNSPTNPLIVQRLWQPLFGDFCQVSHHLLLARLTPLRLFWFSRWKLNNAWWWSWKHRHVFFCKPTLVYSGNMMNIYEHVLYRRCGNESKITISGTSASSPKMRRLCCSMRTWAGEWSQTWSNLTRNPKMAGLNHKKPSPGHPILVVLMVIEVYPIFCGIKNASQACLHYILWIHISSQAATLKIHLDLWV